MPRDGIEALESGRNGQTDRRELRHVSTAQDQGDNQQGGCDGYRELSAEDWNSGSERVSGEEGGGSDDSGWVQGAEEIDGEGLRWV